MPEEEDPDEEDAEEGDEEEEEEKEEVFAEGFMILGVHRRQFLSVLGAKLGWIIFLLLMIFSFVQMAGGGGTAFCSLVCSGLFFFMFIFAFWGYMKSRAGELKSSTALMWLLAPMGALLLTLLVFGIIVIAFSEQIDDWKLDGIHTTNEILVTVLILTYICIFYFFMRREPEPWDEEDEEDFEDEELEEEDEEEEERPRRRWFGRRKDEEE